MKPVSQYLQENLKPSFSDLLLSLMRDKNLTPSEVYKKALMDRKLFSKIISVPNYKPSKKNVCALVLALELDSKTSKQLIKRAGYILTSGSKFDLMIRYCIDNCIYDLYEVEELLKAQSLSILS